MVRKPRGSTERASLRESELAISTLAGETARMTLGGWQLEPPYRVGLSQLVSECVTVDHVAPLSGTRQHQAVAPLLDRHEQVAGTG